MTARDGHIVHSYSNRVTMRIGHAQAMSASHPNKLRPPTDRVYLAALAERLAAQCSLPLDVAHRRVADLAITAKPRAISDGGFSSRGG